MSAPKWPPFIPKVLDDYPLDPYEFRVLARICRRQDGDNGRGCDESNAATAEQCGMSESKVRYAKALLVAAGLVTVSRRNGRTDEYRSTHPDGWADGDRLDQLRAEVRGRRQRPPPTAAPGTAAPGTGVPQTEDRGTTDRAPRHQEPDTAAPSADEGSPRKVLPERQQQAGGKDLPPGATTTGSGVNDVTPATGNDFPVQTVGDPTVAAAAFFETISKSKALRRRHLVTANLEPLVTELLGKGWTAEHLAAHVTERLAAQQNLSNPTGFVRKVLAEDFTGDPPPDPRDDPDYCPWCQRVHRPDYAMCSAPVCSKCQKWRAEVDSEALLCSLCEREAVA